MFNNMVETSKRYDTSYVILNNSNNNVIGYFNLFDSKNVAPNTYELYRSGYALTNLIGNDVNIYDKVDLRYSLLSNSLQNYEKDILSEKNEWLYIDCLCFFTAEDEKVNGICPTMLAESIKEVIVQMNQSVFMILESKNIMNSFVSCGFTCRHEIVLSDLYSAEDKQNDNSNNNQEFSKSEEQALNFFIMTFP